MGVGDEIVAVGQAQRLYDADPSTRIAIVDIDGRPRWHPIWDGNPIVAMPADVAAGEPVRRVTNGPNARPYIVYPFTKESGWTFNKQFRCRDHIARLYLTDAERQRGIDARARYGPYVLIEPFTKHDNFRWSLAQWNRLVAACPDLTFVQHTHDDSPLVNGAYAEEATFREACGLIASCDVYVRSESGLCHAAAALGARQVTLFGGCMDWTVMGGYPGQTMLVDNQDGSPCGAWLPCDHCRAAMERIRVEDVIRALRRSLEMARAA
jgi:ADP-heptose:LPS heptosyltransferase